MSNVKYPIILIVFLLLLLLRFFFFYQNQPKYYNGQYLSFEADLLSQPQISARTQRIMVFLPGGRRVFITVPLFPQFYYGDTIHIVGNLSIKLLNNGDQIYIMNFPKIEAIPHQNFILGEGLAITSLIRQKIISLYEKNLPPISSSLLLGIVFGIKESMPKPFFEDLRSSGVLHIIAASGMNVTMVGGFLSALFTLVLRRQIAIAASIIGIIFYAILAGLEPSIIRASVMGILVFTAQILGRQSWALFGLLIAGFSMLFYNPPTLFDVGFQLSYLATLGILYIRPIFGKSVTTSDFATTISAQAATLPILLANFGTYSLWSIVVNGIVLWTVPFLMILGGIAAVFAFIFEPIGRLALFLALPLLLFFEKTVSFFANLKGIVKIDTLSWAFIIGYYILLISLTVRPFSKLKPTVKFKKKER